jgi:hypothetical protein
MGDPGQMVGHRVPGGRHRYQGHRSRQCAHQRDPGRHDQIELRRGTALGSGRRVGTAMAADQEDRDGGAEPDRSPGGEHPGDRQPSEGTQELGDDNHEDPAHDGGDEHTLASAQLERSDGHGLVGTCQYRLPPDRGHGASLADRPLSRAPR